MENKYEVTDEGIVCNEQVDETTIKNVMIIPRETFIEAYEKYIVQGLLRKKLTE